MSRAAAAFRWLSGWSATWERRGAGAPLGRFGGGWQWKLGIQANEGWTTVIVNLLVASVRLEWRRERTRGRGG